MTAYNANVIQRERGYSPLLKNLTFLIQNLLQQTVPWRWSSVKSHLTRVTWKLHGKTNWFPILRFPVLLFKPICLHSTSLLCLLRHNSVWLLPDFPSCPLAPWGNCQRWLEAILPRQSGEGQGLSSAAPSSWALWPCLTCLAEDRDGHKSRRFPSGTRPRWFWDDRKRRCGRCRIS